MQIIKAWRLGFVEPKDIAIATQIHSRAKRAASAGHDDGSNAIVVTRAGKCVNQFVGHLECEGIQPFGAM